MTSTEFASKYRLLKNVATRGARSFLAQQVELGRMVMVHYLDSEQVEERAATVARLNALQPPARGKLLEIADVDGTPVAVTLFISSFKDFTTWLDSVSVAAPPQPAAPVHNAPPKQAKKKAAGEFTQIFGKVDESTPASAESPLQASASPAARDEDNIPTVIMEAMKRPPAQPAAPAPPPPAPDSGSSFTAIFGSLGEASHTAPELPIAPPIGISSALSAPPAPVIPPPPAAIDLRPAAPSPVPQARAESQPGEFTQLFQRLSPDGGGAPSTPFASPSLAPPEIPRPLETTRHADLAPPALGASLGGASAPRSWNAPAAPAPIGASVFGTSAPSEFTRILSPIAPPPPPPVSIQPPSAPATASAGSAESSKSMLPLIIGLATVVVLTIVIVAYFVLRK